MMKTMGFTCVIVAWAICGSAATAGGQDALLDPAIDADNTQSTEAFPEPTIPDELQDPTFDQYVDMKFLRDAWASLDATALADAGLQLAEGERILFRSHKAISADAVFRIAVKVAAEQRDKETLNRLATAASALGRKDLATLISNAQKLTAQPRAAQPSLTISLNEVTPETLSDYQAMLKHVAMSRLRGDRRSLDELATHLSDVESWPPRIKQHLVDVLAEARKATPESVDSEVDVLDKLQAGSRGNYVSVNFPAYNRGSTYDIYVIGTAKLGPFTKSVSLGPFSVSKTPGKKTTRTGAMGILYYVFECSIREQNKDKLYWKAKIGSLEAAVTKYVHLP